MLSKFSLFYSFQIHKSGFKDILRNVQSCFIAGDTLEELLIMSTALVFTENPEELGHYATAIAVLQFSGTYTNNK